MKNNPRQGRRFHRNTQAGDDVRGRAGGSVQVEEAKAHGADAVLLPKVDSADMVRQAESVIDAAGAPESMAIW